MVNVAFIEKWIEALPQYKQGNKYLRTGEEYCCLGVACDLYQKETGEGEWSSGYISEFRTSPTDASATHLPDSVSEFIFGRTGSSEGAWRLPKGAAYEWRVGSRVASTLIYANDGLHADFNQIADALRAFLKDLEGGTIGE